MKATIKKTVSPDQEERFIFLSEVNKDELIFIRTSIALTLSQILPEDSLQNDYIIGETIQASIDSAILNAKL